MGSVWPVTERDARRVMIFLAPAVVRRLFISEWMYPIPKLVFRNMLYNLKEEEEGN
jgi:hypothetical protein